MTTMTTKPTIYIGQRFSWMGRGAALIAILALAVTALVSCQDFHEGPTEIVESSFDIGESLWLEVNGFNGSITIISGIAGEAVVRASLRQPDRIEYTTHQDGDKIVVTARRLGNFFDLMSLASARIEVTVPRDTYLVLSTSNGGIKVTDVGSRGTLSTSPTALLLSPASKATTRWAPATIV